MSGRPGPHSKPEHERSTVLIVSVRLRPDRALATSKPVRNVGSYWPYASALFDHVRRATPFDPPQSLTAGQVYAMSAYIPYLNNIFTQNAALNATSLPRVEMPNRNGFTRPDPRPDIS